MKDRERNNLIRIERATIVTNAYGDEIPTWTTIAPEWARVFYGRGDERRSAAMVQGSQPATFQVLDNARTRGVTVRDRIVFAGSAWDISGWVPIGRGEIEITAIRGEAPAEAPAPPRGGLNFAVPANSGLLALLLDDLAYVETSDHVGRSTSLIPRTAALSL